jgi:bacillopeptidase F (M6 metalloprotease family)
MILNDIISFNNATYAYIQFNAKWDIEANYDYVQFMISTDNGSSWAPLCGNYTNLGSSNQDSGNPLYDGAQNAWVQEEIDLNNYLGMNNIRFKFRLVSDQAVREDGFAFDDFSIFTDGFDENSISELNETDFNLYPNPSNNKVTLYTTGDNNISNIEIYNNIGQKITSILEGASKTTIDVSDYPDGIYFMKINTNSKQIITNKFTVLK